jgi:hypothetical protein
MSNDESRSKIADLYRDLTSDEQAAVEDTLRGYLAIVKRIFEHVQKHNPEILTELRRRARLRKGRKSA